MCLSQKNEATEEANQHSALCSHHSWLAAQKTLNGLQSYGGV